MSADGPALIVPTASNRRAITPSMLLPGDVLLMRSAGEFSSLVAWLGESEYSHAAVYAGDGVVVEAITPGVVETGLDSLLADEGVAWVDAWRGSSHDGTAWGPSDRHAIAARAGHYLGASYSRAGLVMLGVLAAVRDRTEIQNRRLQRLLVAVLEALAAGVEDGAMICSELVYRSLCEAQTQPPRRLRPVILERIPNPAPMPDLDFTVLALEISRMFGISAQALIADDPLLASRESDGAFDQAHAHARVLLGLPLDGPGSGVVRIAGSGTAPREVPDPVPRLVRPRELEVSPSLRCLGRLK